MTDIQAMFIALAIVGFIILLMALFYGFIAWIVLRGIKMIFSLFVKRD